MLPCRSQFDLFNIICVFNYNVVYYQSLMEKSVCFNAGKILFACLFVQTQLGSGVRYRITKTLNRSFLALSSFVSHLFQFALSGKNSLYMQYLMRCKKQLKHVHSRYLQAQKTILKENVIEDINFDAYWDRKFISLQIRLKNVIFLSNVTNSE